MATGSGQASASSTRSRAARLLARGHSDGASPPIYPHIVSIRRSCDQRRSAWKHEPTPAAGVPSARTTVPNTRVLPGVIVGPGVGNGVVPGGGVAPAIGSGVAAAAAGGSGLGTAASTAALNGVGLALAGSGDRDVSGVSTTAAGAPSDGRGSAGCAHAASRTASETRRPTRFTTLMVRYLPESPVARPVRDPIRGRLQSRSRMAADAARRRLRAAGSPTNDAMTSAGSVGRAFAIRPGAGTGSARF